PFEAAPALHNLVPRCERDEPPVNSAAEGRPLRPRRWGDLHGPSTGEGRVLLGIEIHGVEPVGGRWELRHLGNRLRHAHPSLAINSASRPNEPRFSCKRWLGGALKHPYSCRPRSSAPKARPCFRLGLESTQICRSRAIRVL